MLILLLFVIVDVMCIFDYFLYLCCLYGSEIYLKLKNIYLSGGIEKTAKGSLQSDIYIVIQRKAISISIYDIYPTLIVILTTQG